MFSSCLASHWLNNLNTCTETIFRQKGYSRFHDDAFDSVEVKNLLLTLVKVIGREFLQFKKLQTSIIESIINSRPLIYSSKDDFGKALTPFLLIYGQNIICPRTE